MSVFEDLHEIYQNVHRNDRLSGPRTIDTLADAVDDHNSGGDLAIVLDWESAYNIAQPLDVLVPLPDHVVREHVELATERIGVALDERTDESGTIHAVQSSGAWGMVVDPAFVRLDNEILDRRGVVGIDFEEET